MRWRNTDSGGTSALSRLGSSKRRSRAGRGAALPFLAARDLDGLLDPHPQGVAVIENIAGEWVVLHRFAVGAVGAKRANPPGFEIGPVRRVHLQVELVVRDEGKE